MPYSGLKNRANQLGLIQCHSPFLHQESDCLCNNGARDQHSQLSLRFSAALGTRLGASNHKYFTHYTFTNLLITLKLRGLNNLPGQLLSLQWWGWVATLPTLIFPLICHAHDWSKCSMKLMSSGMKCDEQSGSRYLIFSESYIAIWWH